LWDKVAKSTDVVEVSVSKYVTADLVLVFLEPSDIGRNIVDTWVVSTWEQEAHVDNDNFIVIFKSCHVFTNTHLTDTTNWDDVESCALDTLPCWRIFHANLLATIAVVN